MKLKALLLALTLPWTAALAADPPQPAGSTDPTRPCRLAGWPNELRCGTVQRALDPAAPQGPQIEVHYLVVPSKSRSKFPDPILLLAGGPGQSAIQVAPKVIGSLSGLNNRRDLVFIDQRGTGRSAPLVCPDRRNIPLATLLESGATERALQECKAALEKLPHGDLRQYGTTVAMQDFDAVRQALGVERWNLIGVSYGTRAALEYQRQFPQAVRRTLLDGVAPPDMALPWSMSTDTHAALQALLADCAGEARCAARFPQLAQRWAETLRKLPATVTLSHPVSGVPESVRIDRENALRLVRVPLYVPALRAALPAALDAAAQGRWDSLAGLSAGMGGHGEDRLSEGLHFSVVCAEDLPRMRDGLPGSARPAASSGYAELDGAFYGRVCAQWPRAAVPEAFYSIPPARTPVLLLSGGADPVTPPRHGDRIAQALGSKARHVVAPHLGHGVMRTACLREPLLRFFQAETDEAALQIATDCVQRIPAPTAFLPATAAVSGARP